MPHEYQSTNNTQPTSHNIQRGGPAYLGASRGRTDHQLILHIFRSEPRSVGSSGCQGEQPWPLGCSEAERASGVREFTERLPPDSPQARGARPLPRIPWQPVSWGGVTTYKTTHTNNEGVRGRTPSGTGAGTPFRYTLGHPQSLFLKLRFLDDAPSSAISRDSNSSEVVSEVEFSMNTVVPKIDESLIRWQGSGLKHFCEIDELQFFWRR